MKVIRKLTHGVENCLGNSTLPLNSENSSRKRIVSIDIIKGIAMIMVIIVHYNQSFINANIPVFKYLQMGCQLFFVASGFGIAISFTNKIKHTTVRKATKDFYISRIKAIAPAWWFMMVIVYLINTVVIKISGHTLNFGSNRSISGIIFNALFLQGLNPYCNNNVMPGGWYIGTTMILYAISPIVIMFFIKYSHTKVCFFSSLLSFLSIMGLAFIAYIINPIYINFVVNNNSFGYFSFFTQYPSFAMGILLYFCYSDNKNTSSIKELIIGIIILICSMILFFYPFFLFSYIICASLVGLSSFFILKAMISLENAGLSLNNKLFKLLVLFGKNSLYIFLVHAFFTRPFVSVVNKGLSIIGVNGDSYIVYIFLFPITLFLSYFVGILLKKLCAVLPHLCSRTQTEKNPRV